MVNFERVGPHKERLFEVLDKLRRQRGPRPELCELLVWSSLGARLSRRLLILLITSYVTLD